jgi:hypothetical protein
VLLRVKGFTTLTLTWADAVAADAFDEHAANSAANGSVRAQTMLARPPAMRRTIRENG